MLLLDCISREVQASLVPFSLVPFSACEAVKLDAQVLWDGMRYD